MTDIYVRALQSSVCLPLISAGRNAREGRPAEDRAEMWVWSALQDDWLRVDLGTPGLAALRPGDLRRFEA